MPEWVVQGATVCSLEGELVLFGGDKAGVMSCTAGVLGDWRWSYSRTSGQCRACLQVPTSQHICIVAHPCNLFRPNP